jgi:hypothetical protein
MPLPVKLICGLLAPTPQQLETGRMALEVPFGPIETASEVIPFTYTDYYAREMGATLVRQFVAFAELIDPGRLAEIKNNTIEIENSLAKGEAQQRCRTLNLDPGYLDAAKLVLASTKDYSHRIYLRAGIYAELTLSFNRQGCLFYPWTYADYRTPVCTDFFLRVRRRFIAETSGIHACPNTPPPL